MGSSKSGRNHKGIKGFSLVELLVVMFIVGICLTLASYMFRNYEKKTRLREAVQSYISDIKLAKQLAVSQTVHYVITINKDNNSYTIQDCCNTSDCSATGCVYNATKNFSEYGNTVKIGDNTYNRIIFQTRGTCSSGHISLINDAGTNFKITTSMMGRVKSEEIKN